MEIKTEIIDDKAPNLLVVYLEGDLTLNNANDLRQTIRKHIDKNIINILIDLEKLEYIDSSGIGVLVASLSYLKKKNGKLKLSSIKGNVQNIFEFSKLDLAFSISPSKEEAISTWN